MYAICSLIHGKPAPMIIKSITAYEILASGGYPTLEARVMLENGAVGTASVPYGASAGSHEATVLIDGDAHRYNGQGMLKAVRNVTEIIAPALIGKNSHDQRACDNIMRELDGTPNKSHLGGNAILAVSVAIARAAAADQHIELYQHLSNHFVTTINAHALPKPMVVAIEGGKHADNSTDLQEYCLSALGTAPTAEKIRTVLETYHTLKKILQKAGFSTNVGNEGAFAPDGIPNNEVPLKYLTQAIEQAGYEPGVDIGISIDAAASEFFEDGMYNLKLEKKKVTAHELTEYYLPWLKKYPIVTVEDMHHEDEWEEWSVFKKLCDEYSIPLIGDDLTVTNIDRLNRAISTNAISGILIKLNQIGTVTETIDCCLLAKHEGMITVTSHRGGGETNDAAMVDVAVAVGSAYIKVGPTRGERVSKYNRLLEIERQLR